MDGRELGQVSTLVNRKNMTSECSILSTLVYLPGQNTYSMGQNTKQYKNCGGGKSGNQTVPRSKKLLIQTTPHVLTQRQIKPYTHIRICTYMYRLRSNQIEKEAIKLTLLISSLASRQDLLAEVSLLTLPQVQAIVRSKGSIAPPVRSSKNVRKRHTLECCPGS